jgi:hypothetical protein
VLQEVLFGISIPFGLVVWGIFASRYIWPALRDQPRPQALWPLLMLHSFRFVGLAFLVSGVVSPDLPLAFARPAAYGDFVAALLALLSLATLQHRNGIIFVWIFNVWGTADLLYAFYQGIQNRLLPGQLGSTYFILTVLVPLLLVTHWLVFRILLRDKAAI